MPSSIAPVIGTQSALYMIMRNAINAVYVIYIVPKVVLDQWMMVILKQIYIIVRVVAYVPKNVPKKQ